MTDAQRQALDIYMAEYGTLKDEQIKRIGFRDNLLYTTLVIFGVIFGFVQGDKANPYALLVLPWASLILGWTYLVNDQKITEIGRYIRYTLVAKVSELTEATDPESIFGWEIAHRSDRARKRRKLEQCIIDELTFVVSGIVAIVFFWNSSLPKPDWSWILMAISTVEIILLVILGKEIIVYADLASGR